MEPVEAIVHLVAVEREHAVAVRLASEQRRVGQIEGEIQRQHLAGRDRRGGECDAFGGDEVDRAEHVVASEHVPCMAQAEAGDLGEVVEIRKRRSSCHRFTVLGGDAILRAAANVCTGHMS